MLRLKAIDASELPKKIERDLPVPAKKGRERSQSILWSSNFDALLPTISAGFDPVV